MLENFVFLIVLILILADCELLGAVVFCLTQRNSNLRRRAPYKIRPELFQARATIAESDFIGDYGPADHPREVRL
jgi:hypothetical protein